MAFMRDVCCDCCWTAAVGPSPAALTEQLARVCVARPQVSYNTQLNFSLTTLFVGSVYLPKSSQIVIHVFNHFSGNRYLGALIVN